MNDVYIVKSAVATGLGNTLEANWKRLVEGDSAVDGIRHFRTNRLGSQSASCIDELWQGENENRICRLMESILPRIQPVPKDTFVIWTGIKGNAEYIESGQMKTIPFLPRHFRHWVAETLAIDNNGMEVNASCASSTVGLALGAAKIARGECSSVLVCAADLVSRFVFTGFSALKALTPGVCRPFDRRRNGLCLGDGAVAILLADGATAETNRLERCARIGGWGISNDANHITGPARDGRGLAQAMGNALQMAGIPPESLDAFCAHGTGTVYNDGMELAAIRAVFRNRQFPVFSVKGAIGHTLGAAGGIETAIGAHCLDRGIVPPTIGFEDPETGADGRVSSGVQPFGGQTLLTTNSGFGGVNAALLLMGA